MFFFAVLRLYDLIFLTWWAQELLKIAEISAWTFSCCVVLSPVEEQTLFTWTRYFAHLCSSKKIKKDQNHEASTLINKKKEQKITSYFLIAIKKITFSCRYYSSDSVGFKPFYYSFMAYRNVNVTRWQSQNAGPEITIHRELALPEAYSTCTRHIASGTMRYDKKTQLQLE
jgi:hypothetical protein